MTEPPVSTSGSPPSPATPPAVSVMVPRVGRGRPHPRWDQYKRTWYFFSRNGLALAGLVIVLFFAGAFFYGLAYQASGTQLQEYCLTEGLAPPGNCYAGYPTICTYTQGTPSPLPSGCYATPAEYPAFVSPTARLYPATLGPLPFGSLSTSGSTEYVYNLYDGLVKGSVWSLSMSVSIVGAGALLGLLIGCVAGFYGGVVDEVLMRLTDIFLSIPGILLVIVVVIAATNLGVTGFTNRLLLVIGAFTITWWPLYARIVRGQVLVTREQKFVEAARASGASSARVIRRHILPNSLYPVFVQMSLDVGTVPLLIASIVFIGFTTILPTHLPEWGSIAATSTQSLPSILSTCAIGTCVLPWWQILFPGLALFFFAISVNFVADGLRDALDPRLRR
jgi:peptide/nickel transport system permease protein